MRIAPKTAAEIELMRRSGQMTAEVLDLMRQKTAAGTTTGELAELAAAAIKRLGGEAVLLGYDGFPSVICISVNDEVVHGIPGGRRLGEGDIVGYDLCVGYQGMICDSAITVPVGQISGEANQLLEVTQAALGEGIKAAQPGRHIEDISKAIEKRLHAGGFGVVEALCGHGVGYEVHEDPEIPNFSDGRQGPLLEVGQTLALEPMATLGGKAVFMAPDRWTIKTVDGSLAAQFEHTILISETGAEVLTRL